MAKYWMSGSRHIASSALLLSLLVPGCAHARPTAASRPTTSPPPTVPALSAEEVELERVGLSIRELAPDVLLAVQRSPKQSSANVLVVRVRDGSVVICSSPYDTGATRALVRYVRARFAPSRIIAINTHFHADGTAGNEGYAAEGVATYASDHTVALQAERGRAGLAGMARYIEAEDPALAERIRGTRVVAAQQVFAESEGLSLTFASESVLVAFMGGGHSPDNVVVHFPDRGVLFGGCMVRSDPGLGNTADADLAHWATTAESAAGLSPRIVVPGHGSPGGTELLTATAAAVRSREHERGGVH
jgi:glyoxylase-like metal-dependent hydrolase (beta-lactamase superfamily II)